MDLQTSAQLLGNLGEFITAVAVIVTLIYVAAQVKQGKAALDANTRAMEREYELKAQEALKVIAESVAQAEEQITAVQINQNPGRKRYWDLNRQDLILWGYEGLVQAVDAAREEVQSRVSNQH
jgi:hypothetical protein